MISKNGNKRCMTIKSLSRLLRSSNTKHKCKQYFCTNCLHGFSLEASRGQHQVYCKDNEAVGVEMPRKGETIEFCDGQNQFNVPFVMFYDLEALLPPPPGGEQAPASNEPSSIKVNQHIPCGWNVKRKIAMEKSLTQRRVIKGRITLRLFVGTS